jgi:solute carrier family 24 (sodium/potassium/calcium exchanger), member 6
MGGSGLFIDLTSGEGYTVNISPTLLVSTVSLFVSLSSMLIVVPLSNWKMTRTFGICLVLFFTASTVASVLVEILV